VQILRLYGILSPAVLGTVFGCNSCAISGAFMVQILQLSGRFSEAVLGQFSATISVLFWGHFWCRFYYFRSSFSGCSGAVFGCNFGAAVSGASLVQILRLYGILSPVVLGAVFGCISGAISGAFLVQILLLSGRVSAVVLGQLSAAISVLFLVHFYCRLYYFRSSFSGCSGAVFGCNLGFGAVLITPRYSFSGSSGAVFGCNYGVAFGAFQAQISASLRYNFCGCSRVVFGCNFGAIPGASLVQILCLSGILSPAVLGAVSSAILVLFLGHFLCKFCYSPVNICGCPGVVFGCNFGAV
jgi:hypothetical protein